MLERNTSSGITVTGRIDARAHSLSTLRDSVQDWDSLTKREKHLVVRPPERIDFGSLDEGEVEYAKMEVEPDETIEEYNTTCVGLHELIVDELDPGVTTEEDASHLALGNSGGGGTSSSDTSLNNEVYRETVTDHANNGNELLASTFVDSTEANGYTLDELGLFTSASGGSNILLNHSTFASVTKDNTKTVTFDVTLTFTAA